MTLLEYIKELELFNPNLPIKKSIPQIDNCIFQEPIKPQIIMVDDWHGGTTKSGYCYRYTYEKKPILVI